VVASLLNLHPDMGRWSARKRDKKGRTPLYYALRYDAPSGVVELLLMRMRREDVLEGDGEGNSVLGLVWDTWATSLEGKKILGGIGKKLEDFDSMGKTDSEASWSKRMVYAEKLRVGMKGKVKDKWDTTNLLLRGAFRFPLEEKEEEAEEEEEGYDFCSEQVNVEDCNPQRKWRVLHATTAVRCHPTLFKMACAIHPEQAREIDENDLFSRTNGVNDRRAALHFASENSSKDPRDARDTQRMLQVLLSLHPQAASFINPTDGRLPLHYLCKNDSKVHWYDDGLGDVHDAYPRAALVEDKMGRTPLHHAASILALRQTPPSPQSGCSNGGVNCIAEDASGSILQGGGSILQELVLTHPSTATIADKDGKLPLHIIAMVAENWDAGVQTVYEMFPQAMRRRTTRKANSRYPIHLVSSNPDARRSLVDAIVERHPMGASSVDGDGMLPLHIMCESGKTWHGGLERVHNAYPKAIGIAEDNARGWLPLHFIVALPGVSLDLIREIIDIRPQAARTADGNGKTPLHVIAESGKDWEYVEAVFSANPGAITVEDSQGKVPFIAAALCVCDNDGTRNSCGGGVMVANEVLLIDSLSLAPSASSCNDNSTLQGTDSTVITTTTQAIEEMMSPSSQSYGGERGDTEPRDTSISQLNILYNLLMAAPYILN